MSLAHDPADVNRRGSRRKGLRRACVLHLANGDTRAGTTIDVGVDGLCVLTSRPVAAGTRCRVSFELPGGSGDVRIDAAVRTVYSSYGSDGFKIGASFTDVGPAMAAALAAFVVAER